MIPISLLPHSVVKVRPVAGSDTYNDVTLDYDGGTRTTMVGRVIGRTTTELRRASDEGRDADEQGWTLLTNETDIVATDRIEWAEHPAGMVTFEVDGPPLPKYEGSDYHHTRVILRVLNG
ncbi:MAG: hypothetical protein GY925_10395 [Actinomycetia bacterium]|nr:hypothetical protein [Actinomycetes bacterium]